MTSERRSGLRVASVLRRIAVAIMCLAIVAPTAALAQSKKGVEPTPEEQKGYTMPYVFTLVGFMAVVIPICMAAGRRWDVVKDDKED